MKRRTEQIIMGALFALVPPAIAGGLVAMVSPITGTFVFVFILGLGLDVLFNGTK